MRRKGLLCVSHQIGIGRVYVQQQLEREDKKAISFLSHWPRFFLLSFLWKFFL